MSKSIKANAFFKTLLSIINIVFPLITAPYVARILSVDGYTEYNKAFSMIGWFSPFAIFGVYTYGMRTISQIKNDKNAVSKLFTQLFCFSVFASITVTIVYLSLVLFLPSFKTYRYLYVIMSTQILFICFSTDWANEAFENYGFILVKSFICRFLYVISVFLFVKKSEDVLIYVTLSSSSVILNNLLTFTYAKTKIKISKINIHDELSLIKSLFVVFLLVNSSMLYTIFDRFILTWFGNKLSLTYYNISQVIVVAVVNVCSSIVLVSIPRLSYLWANNQKDEYYRLLNKTSSTFLAFHTPCCIGLACISSEVIYYYSGMKYISASIPLLFFALRYYVSAYDMILSKQVLLATGNEKVLTKIYYLGGIYNVLVKVLLIFTNNLKPELCIITTATADILVIVLQIINIKKLNIDFKIYSKEKIKYLITCLLFVPIIVLIKKFIPFDGVKYITLRTFASIISCSLLYFLMMIISKDELVKTIFHKRNTSKGEEINV